MDRPLRPHHRMDTVLVIRRAGKPFKTCLQSSTSSCPRKSPPDQDRRETTDQENAKALRRVVTAVRYPPIWLRPRVARHAVEPHPNGCYAVWQAWGIARHSSNSVEQAGVLPRIQQGRN